MLLATGIAVALKFQYLSRALDPVVDRHPRSASCVSMYALARPYFRRLTAACAMRSSGVPRVSDEELKELVESPRAHLITLIGVSGWRSSCYLMINKPGLGWQR